MKKSFNFHMRTEIVFDPGAASRASEWVKGKRAFIVCDPFIFGSGAAEKVGEGLAGIEVAYFKDIAPNPSCECADAAAEAAREHGADCVIGMGGGSSLDVAKAVACLITNPGSIYDYSGGAKQFVKREAQLICIPTTAGTGSEVTNVGVFTDTKTGKKSPMLSPLFWPDVALIDSVLTHTLPPSVTASTGMDAFCHAIEAYWNRDAQPICDAVAMSAMRLILGGIKTACEPNAGAEARENLSLASVLAGVAFNQTRTTGCHAISFPLTADYGAPHGEACAITLPAFIRVSGEKEKEKMETLAAFLGYSGLSDFADGIEGLLKSLGLRTRLGQLGVKDGDIERIAAISLDAPVIHLSPAEMNTETLTALLRSIL